MEEGGSCSDVWLNACVHTLTSLINSLFCHQVLIKANMHLFPPQTVFSPCAVCSSSVVVIGRDWTLTMTPADLGQTATVMKKKQNLPSFLFHPLGPASRSVISSLISSICTSDAQTISSVSVCNYPHEQTQALSFNYYQFTQFLCFSINALSHVWVFIC